mgnify:CR=1 FL=1
MYRGLEVYYQDLGVIMRTNQVNTLLPSLPRCKKKESNFFQVIVAGILGKVKRFWEYLKFFSGYRLSRNYQELFDHFHQNEVVHVVMQLEEMPTSLHRKESIIQIQTKDGKSITISLLYAQAINMLNGMVYIQGKSYDIFADPNKDSEVLDCKIVNGGEECLKWN